MLYIHYLATALLALNQLSHELDVLLNSSSRLSILNFQKHCMNNGTVIPKQSQTHQETGPVPQLLPRNLGAFALYLLSRPATVRLWLLLPNPYSWALSPQSLSLKTYRRNTTRNLRWAEYRTDVEVELTPIVELTPAPLPLLAPHMCQQSMSLLSPRSHLSPWPLF